MNHKRNAIKAYKLWDNAGLGLFEDLIRNKRNFDVLFLDFERKVGKKRAGVYCSMALCNIARRLESLIDFYRKHEMSRVDIVNNMWYDFNMIEDAWPGASVSANKIVYSPADVVLETNDGECFDFYDFKVIIDIPGGESFITYTNDDGIMHPHINSGVLCLGEAKALYNRMVETNQFYEACLLIERQLAVYTPDGAYYPLGSAICPVCDSNMRNDERCYVDCCGVEVCEDCVCTCNSCDETNVCLNHVQICGHCGYSYCGPCWDNESFYCDYCGDTFCSADCAIISCCEDCNNFMCEACTRTCENCGHSYCINCLEDGQCKKCLENTDDVKRKEEQARKDIVGQGKFFPDNAA